jgi:cyclopropane-fatty-acyl-phospholipid synthase
MTAASERSRLIASEVENLRLQYSYTLRHWLERACARRREIEAMYDALLPHVAILPVGGHRHV